MEQPERLALAQGGRWRDLRTLLLAAEYAGKPGTATNVANQARAFFDDDGSTVWITFHAGRLHWARLLGGEPLATRSGREGVWRKVDGRWRSADLHGAPLEMTRLSGRLTKLVGFRGTSCAVRPPDLADYTFRRINGQIIPEVEAARDAVTRVTDAAVHLMRLLEPRDFETLVDLVFTTTGWRRLGPVGGPQKTIDMELELPTTGEQAFVQVKSRATAMGLKEYIGELDQRQQDAWMFFVYHTGEVATDDERVKLVGPDQLAKLVLNAGLIGWLIDKAS